MPFTLTLWQQEFSLLFSCKNCLSHTFCCFHGFYTWYKSDYNFSADEVKPQCFTVPLNLISSQTHISVTSHFLISPILPSTLKSSSYIEERGIKNFLSPFFCTRSHPVIKEQIPAPADQYTVQSQGLLGMYKTAARLHFSIKASEIIYQCYSSGTMTTKDGLVQESCNGLDVLD